MYDHLIDIHDLNIVILDKQEVQKSFPKTKISTVIHNSSSNTLDLCN